MVKRFRTQFPLCDFGVGTHNTKEFFEMPAEYPTIQSSSDAIYLEIVPDPTGYMTALHSKPTPCHIPMISPISYKSEIPWTSSSSVSNLLAQLTELRET